MKGIRIYPLLLAVYPVLSLFAANLGQTPLEQLWIPLLLAAAAAAALNLVLAWTLGDAGRGALAAAGLILLFFSYRHFADILHRLPLPLPGGALYLGGGAAGLAAIIYLTRRPGTNLRPATRIMTVIALVLFALPLIRIVLFQARTRPGFTPPSPAEAEREGTVAGRDYLPNIYYLVLDAYGRGDILEAVYDYDNRPFLSLLEDQGFYIAERSGANYGQSVLSLTSSLNFQYLDELIGEIGPDNRDRHYLTEMMNENRVFRFLKRFGYTTVGFDAAGPYSPVWVRNLDRFYPFDEKQRLSISLNNFQTALINSTPLAWLFRKNFLQLLDCPYDIHRHKLLSALETIEELSREEGPLFVYGHLLIPHQPFVFAEDGTPLTPDYDFDIWVWERKFRKDYRSGYIGQLSYLNRRLRQLLPRIIRNSIHPPVIILQADHGPALYLDMKRPHKTFFPERMAILNAYYLPETGPEGLYPSISPVNTFRVLFNNYFGTDYELLEDRSFFSSWDHPYRVYDITEKIKAPL